MPDVLELPLTLSTNSDSLPRCSRSCATAYALSNSSAAERARTGGRVLGRRAVLAQQGGSDPEPCGLLDEDFRRLEPPK